MLDGLLIEKLLQQVLPSGEIVNAGKQTSRHRVQKSGKLIVRSISVQDSGIYRCVATTHNPEIVESDIATLKINVIELTKGLL